MVSIPEQSDPTLDALDTVLVNESRTEAKRTHLGASQIGDPCSRKLWYRLNATQTQPFDAATLRRFIDGHRTEDLVVSWLQKLSFIELHVKDDNGRQYGFKDGRFQGSYDGVIRGLIQSPKTWHIFEVKCVNEKKFAELNSLKATYGEKRALEKWDATYYAQAVTYMAYEGLKRHYLVCATPGGRNLTSVRTDENPELAAQLSQKAQAIITAKSPPGRVSEKPDFYLCRFCEFKDVCHVNKDAPTVPVFGRSSPF